MPLNVGYTPRRHPQTAVFVALLTALLGFVICMAGMIMFAPAYLGDHALGFVETWQEWSTPGAEYAIWRQVHSALFVAVLTAFLAGVQAWYTTPLTEPFATLDPTDPQLCFGDAARLGLQESFAESYPRQSTGGLYLAPHLALPMEAETSGIITLGASGSGKSMIIRGWAEQSAARGDKLVIHCNKGDMTQSFDAHDAILIAAHHRDSHAWDIGKDIADFACAGQFAYDLIEESNPPHFSQSGRLIVTDVIVSLIMTQRQTWTAVTLLEALLAQPHEIAERIAIVPKNSGHLLQSSDLEGIDKTLLGIMGTIWSAALNGLRPLAWAWANVERHPRFSVTDWLDDDYKGPRILLLQSSFEYAQLSSLVAGGILKRIASKLSDPAIKPDPKRRVSMFLDEFYMLSEIKNLTEALAVGREKGLVAVLGFQSYSQLIEQYGDKQASILWDMFQIKVFSRQVPGEATTWLSTIMGTRKISALLPNRARGPGDAPNVERHEDYPTFAPARLAKELGVFKIGKREVRGLVYFKGNAYRIDWPFTIWGKKREGYVVAEWMNEIPKSVDPKPHKQPEA